MHGDPVGPPASKAFYKNFIALLPFNFRYNWLKCLSQHLMDIQRLTLDFCTLPLQAGHLGLPAADVLCGCPTWSWKMSACPHVRWTLAHMFFQIFKMTLSPSFTLYSFVYLKLTLLGSGSLNYVLRGGVLDCVENLRNVHKYPRFQHKSLPWWLQTVSFISWVG